MENIQFIQACQTYIFNFLSNLDEISFDVTNGKCEFFSIHSMNVPYENDSKDWNYLRDKAKELFDCHIKDNYEFHSAEMLHDSAEVILCKNGAIIINQ